MNMIGFIDLQMPGAGEEDTKVLTQSEKLNYSLSYLLFRRGPSGYIYESSGSCPDEDSASLPERLKSIDEFYLSLPLELLDFRIISLPFSDSEKLKKVIPFELDNLIMDGSDSVIFDFVILKSTDSGYEILVAYAKKKLISDILERVSSLNIDPKIITSIDLGSLIRTGRQEFALNLVNHKGLDAGNRIDAALEELKSQTINLRTGIFAYTKDDEKTARSLSVTFILLVLLVLTIHADLAFRIADAKKEASAIKTEMRNIYTNLFPDEKKISDELYQMKSHMKQIRDKGGALTGIAPLQFMLNVSQKIQGASFSEISLDSGLITMKGEVDSVDDTDMIKKGLSRFLSDVSISDIRPSADGSTMFTAVAKPGNDEAAGKK